MWLVVGAAAPGTAALVTRNGEAVAPADAEPIHAATRTELERAGLYKLQGAADTLLGVDQAEAAGWKCSGEPACLAQLGRALGVGTVFHGEVSKAPAGLRLMLTSVDVEKGTLTTRGIALLPPAPAGRQAAIQRAVRAVLKQGQTLTIHNQVGNAGVELDGEPLELSQSESTVSGVSPGPHLLRITLPGASPSEQTLVVGNQPPPPVHIAARGLQVRVGGQSASAPATDAPPATSSGSAGVLSLVPVLLMGTGVSVAEVSVAVMLGSALTGLVGAIALGTLAREPKSQKVMAKDGQSRAQLEAQLMGGQALLGVGGILGAVGLVVALVAAALGAGGVGTWVFLNLGGQ